MLQQIRAAQPKQFSLIQRLVLLQSETAPIVERSKTFVELRQAGLAPASLAHQIGAAWHQAVAQRVVLPFSVSVAYTLLQRRQ